jgi:hypothetical protein
MGTGSGASYLFFALALGEPLLGFYVLILRHDNSYGLYPNRTGP